MADIPNDEPIKILLVEDNPGDALLVRLMLEESGSDGFDLTGVERLDEATERLAEEDFSVVLLDLSLPDSHGLETVARMRVAAPEVPVVVLSGLNDEELALQALRSGAQDYLVKGQGDGSLIARSIRYAIERKRAEEHLAYLAQYDQLTGLTNRVLFQDRLNQALARADRDNNLVALMFMDLDRFKSVNDTLGHAIGDLLLQQVAERLKGSVRETDTVARMGGDEFSVILEDISYAEDAALVAKRITDALSQPFILDGHEVFVTVSIGIAICPPCGRDTMIKDADAAMYRAKELGRNTYQFHTEEMNVQNFERLAFESNLRRATNQEEFQLYYQPQVDLRTGQITGVEALLRWRHPDLGPVSPAKFVPVLEDTGLIVDVGEWVLSTACNQLKAWQDVGLSSLRVAVNISARQFRQENFHESIARILREVCLDPHCLELELTESLLMEDMEAYGAVLRELKAMGLRVVIDDFGTGYSSLAYLKRFPVDALKIDGSFVRDIATDPDDAAIAAAIISLAHELHLRVIAECVETREQLAYLRDHGCDEGQGYYFSHPLPADDFTGLLKKKDWKPKGVSYGGRRIS